MYKDRKQISGSHLGSSKEACDIKLIQSVTQSSYEVDRYVPILIDGDGCIAW